MNLAKIVCVGAVSLGLAACQKAQKKTSATSASATAATTSMASKKAQWRKNHLHQMGMEHWQHAWFASTLFRATRDIKLTDAQKASVAKVKHQFAAADPNGKKAFKDFNDALIAGVKAGKIDAAKLKPLYAEIDKAVQARHTEEVQALNGLHAALDPAARKALVAAVQKRQSARKEHMVKAAAKVKDWKAQFAKRRLERMNKELDLDAAQQKKVQDLFAQDQLPKPTKQQKAAANKRVDDLLTAFAKDKFDAKTLDLGELPAKNAHTMMAHRVAFLNKLLPILKPAQRDKYATALEHRPAMGGWMGHHPAHRMRMQLPFDHAPQAPVAPTEMQK